MRQEQTHFHNNNKDRGLWGENAFPVAKFSLYRACSSRDVFLRRLPSPSYLNYFLICMIYELSSCLGRRLLKRRATVALSDLAGRTYARVEPINLSRIYAPSACIRIFSNPQLFLSGYDYRPHVSGEFDSESGKK